MAVDPAGLSFTTQPEFLDDNAVLKVCQSRPSHVAALSHVARERIVSFGDPPYLKARESCGLIERPAAATRGAHLH